MAAAASSVPTGLRRSYKHRISHSTVHQGELQVPSTQAIENKQKRRVKDLNAFLLMHDLNTIGR